MAFASRACVRPAARPALVSAVEGFEKRVLLAFSSDSTDAALPVGTTCPCGCQSAASQLTAQATSDGSLTPVQPPRLRDATFVRLHRTSGVESFWRPMNQLPRERARATQVVHASAMAPFRIDLNALRRTLRNAPMEFTAAAAERPLVMTLPNPDGGFSRFAVWESPLLQGATYRKFSNIRTYAGQGLDDPTQVLRFDVSPQGLRATILGGSGSYYIDPVFHRSTDVFVAYRREDAFMHPDNVGFVCLTRADDAEGGLEQNPVTPESNSGDGGDPSAGPSFGETERSGTQLRTYRLAVATTGEYTAFHGGTVAGGLAAVVTAVNRMNVIYERDLSIRMTLVPNNDLLIYTNAATDPFTSPSSASTTAQQNHNNTVAVIGVDNFDIGHVFHRGSNNGVAGGIGIVGNATLKGRGYSSHSSPVNDPFVIDYVAHEVGHQFGGRHSFSNCGGGAGDSAVFAVEPGSGSTIMAYAGICGSGFDLQSNSDAMFHSINFDQIISFVDNSIPGVGTRTSTGNLAPVIQPLTNRTIPASTPFELTAVATDANGDTLTYSWEQRDGASGTPVNTTTSTTGPMIRALLPTTSPTRSIPNPLDLRNNTTTMIGERLPSVARNLNFTVIVRDNRAGGGGVNTANMLVAVVNTGSAFAVTSPNTAVSWPLGSTQTVTWNVAGTTGSGINTANVRIRLSTDGGVSFPHVLLESTPNNGSAQVTLPSTLPATNAARIRVEAVGNIFFDISNVNFTLLPPAPTPPVLTPETDTGISDSDGLTRFNNATLDTRLAFTVGNLVPGALVRLLRNNVLVASGVAPSDTMTLFTSGSSAFPDGPATFTVTQQLGSLVSPASPPATVTIDTVAPTAAFTLGQLDRNAPVSNLPVTFSENVFNLTLDSFEFLLDGEAFTPASATLTGGGSSFELTGLAADTTATGVYAVGLLPTVTDAAGNPAAGSLSFTNNVLTLPDTGDNTVTVRVPAGQPERMLAFVNVDPTSAPPTLDWTFTAGQTLRIVGGSGRDTVRFEGLDVPAVAPLDLRLAGGPLPGDLLEVAAGVYRSTVGPATPVRVSVFSNARVELDAPHTLRDLTIAANAVVAVSDTLDLTGTLTIAHDGLPPGQRSYTGFLDIRGGDGVIVRNGDLASLREMARFWWTAGGGLPGTAGLGASPAFYTAEGAFRTVGIFSNLGYPGSPTLTTFAGRSVAPTDVLLRYTLLGDSNLDGVLDADDLSRALAGFNGTGSAIPGGSGWNFGDIDYDGVTTFTDIGRILAAIRG
ncbi:MAG: reprolysin-like metallopeptidase [Tepidisphaerales bacterium]